MRLFFAYIQVPAEHALHVDVTMKITSLIWTCYTLVKQAASAAGSVANRVPDTHEVAIAVKRVPVANLKALFTKICSMYGLQFNNTLVSKEMRGTFQVNLCQI